MPARPIAPEQPVPRAGRAPDGRNRYVDLVRLVAILAVMGGHWLATIIEVDGGRPRGVSSLAVVEPMRWLTLVLQVMPMFFLAGGYAAAASWPAWQARGGRWAGWTHARLTRLLRPTTWFLAIMGSAVAVALLLGADRSVVAQAGWGIALQLWFLPVYMLLILLAVPMVRAWHRGGWRVLAVALALLAAVDVLMRVADVRGVGWLSYLLAPGAGLLLGIAWQAGAFARRSIPLAMLLGGTASLLVLVLAFDYPPWMVGVPGEPTSNTAPPNLALAAYATAQIGAVLLLEQPLRRWLRRPRAWRLTARGNAVIMTLYLWHMVPVVLVAAVMVALDLPSGPEPGTAAWWLLRPVWIALLGVVLLGLVRLVGRFELAPVRPAEPAGPLAFVLLLACVALTAYALSRLAVGGFAPSGHLALVPLGAYAAGVAALHLAGRVGARR